MTTTVPRIALLVLTGIAALMPLHAQQYRSEVRVLDTPPEQKPKADPEKLLRQAGSAYERAMLLREMQLFPDWLLGKHLSLELGVAEQEMLDKV
ncbi:MAG: hypothetical protein ACPGE9_14830, partial [Algiphilus sp.]